MTTEQFIRNANDQDEFGLADEDGMVHGYVVHHQRDDDGTYMFSVIGSLCYYGCFHKDRWNEIVSPVHAVNCFLCIARVLELPR